jgi:hypothetical protein
MATMFMPAVSKLHSASEKLKPESISQEKLGELLVSLANFPSNNTLTIEVLKVSLETVFRGCTFLCTFL